MSKTNIIRIDPLNPEPEKISEAAHIIRRGGVAAFPTETVYGLGAIYNDDEAVERIYKIKNRPENKPLTLHISDIAMLRNMGCMVNARASKLIGKYWPGPLTLILKTMSGKKTIGVRMPANKIARTLIDACGAPIVAPSANLSGNKAPVSAEDVLKDLDGKIDLVIDGGQTDIGIESTIVDASEDSVKILRQGAIPAEEIMTLNG